MRKKAKESSEILYGVEVWMVARKAGEEDWEKKITHDKGIELRDKKKFVQNGWRVTFYQIGFYTPKNK